MTFRVTARDNRAGGGGVDYAATTVTVAAAAGPFAVTAPNTARDLGRQQRADGDLERGRTDAAPVSCANVAILLSTDGGNTFPAVLAASHRPTTARRR